MKLTPEKPFVFLLGTKYPALVFTGQVYTNNITKSSAYLLIFLSFVRDFRSTSCCFSGVLFALITASQQNSVI